MRTSALRLAAAAAAALALAAPALAQRMPGYAHGARGPGGQGFRMSPEERQRLREQVRGGEMSREQARERWREERARGNGDASRLSPQDREQLRRDVQDANRTLDKR